MNYKEEDRYNKAMSDAEQSSKGKMTVGEYERITKKKYSYEKARKESNEKELAN